MEKRRDFLAFGAPQVGQAEIDEVVDTLKSRWWGTGPKVKRLEKIFADYVQAKHALALNSCTAGMFLVLKAMNVGPGDEVITTPFTFCATANVILHCGATPVFADIDLDDWNIDPAEVERKITPRTKVIMPVHIHGRPCRMDEITALAKAYKLKVVEDAAHAVEASYRGRKIGSISDATAFSFYATKNVATGEGGMVTSNDEELMEKMRVLSLHGLAKSAYNRYASGQPYQPYETILPGYKFNMMDIQAALGLHQLDRVDQNALVRRRHWQAYEEAFKNIPEIITPKPEAEETYHARHLYAILVSPNKLDISRNEFVNELIQLNIGSGVHFYPVHLHSYYRELYGFQRGDYPNAEFVGERTVSLPLTAAISDEDVRDVITAVKWLIEKHRR